MSFQEGPFAGRWRIRLYSGFLETYVRQTKTQTSVAICLIHDGWFVLAHRTRIGLTRGPPVSLHVACSVWWLSWNLPSDFILNASVPATWYEFDSWTYCVERVRPWMCTLYAFVEMHMAVQQTGAGLGRRVLRISFATTNKVIAVLSTNRALWQGFFLSDRECCSLPWASFGSALLERIYSISREISFFFFYK